MKRLIGIVLATVIGVSLVPRGADAAEPDTDILELMLHGVTAVYSSTVMAMNAYRSGLLTKEEANAEIARNKAFLAVLLRCATSLERSSAPDEYDDISFAKDFGQVCSYLEFALDSFSTFVAEGDEIDRRLFDRYLFKGEQTMNRLLKEFSGE